MTLICKPSIVPGETSPDDRVVPNDGFFPDIDAVSLRRAIRVRDGVLADRLRIAIVAAIIAVANDARDTGWLDRQGAAGYRTLAEIPSELVDGESRLVACYRRAIACLVKAELVERYRDVDTTARGDRDITDLDSSIDELRRDARHAIRDLLGRRRTTVALI